jgi:phosphohistidine phosphatase
MPWWFYKQSAVIPYRFNEGSMELLLITSRRSGRWIVPKGVVDLGKTASEAAANEAYEEAGVRGQISSSAIGEYDYLKWGGTCTVKVFLLEVQTVLDVWPEQDERRREWMSVEQAAQSISEEELRRMILSVPDSMDKSKLL